MRVLSPAVVVVVAVISAAPSAYAASGACTSDAQCTAPQVCRLSESICVRTAVDLTSLQAAITAANADVARDVIVLGSANPDDTEQETHVEFADTDVGSFVVDAEFGPLAFPVIKTPITIEGNSVALATLDASTSARMFVVRTDAVLDAQPDLTLKNMTIIDARPGPAGVGAVFFGGGAVHVSDVATTGGLLATFNADSVVFSSNGDDDDAAPADAVVVLEGGPAVLVNCSFADNVGTLAGALLSSATSLTVTGGDFTHNVSAAVGAASASTDASFTNVTFAENDGPVAGGIHATAGALRITGGAFRDNNSSDGAGAVLTATDTNVAGTARFTGNRGGTVAGIDETSSTATLSMNNSTFDDNHGALAGGVRSVAATTTVRNGTFTNNSADDGAGGLGGALQARSASVQGGVYRSNFAAAGGGAIAVTNAPAGATQASEVVSAILERNSSDGGGGAILDTGAALTITDSTLSFNTADAGGGALSVASLAAGNDVDVNLSSFVQNRARPGVAITSADATLDELGDDTGQIEFRVLGTGSAVLVAGAAASAVNVHDNCIIGNAALALDVGAGGGMTANDNWFGNATGPFPLGDGDSVNSVAITIGSFHDDAAGLLCEPNPFSAYERLFLGVTVTGAGAGAAEINSDYHVIDPNSGGTLLGNTAGDVTPDLHIGKLVFDFVGVNDDDNEGNEIFTFTIPPCQDAGCDYLVTGGETVQFVVSDNGDGIVGEGEGEGEDCDEKLTITPGSLELPNTGEASSTSLKVKNDSDCDVQLFAPLVKKGASLGFSVDPIVQADLLLTPGDVVNIVVHYDPPDEPPEDGAAPVGELQLETTRGTIEKIPLGLVNNCACSSSSQRSPAMGLAFVAALAAFIVRRRHRRS